jgi:hypothetical protein
MALRIVSSFRATAMSATILVAGSNETLEEGLQDGIVLLGNRCTEQGGSDRRSPAADEAFAAPLAGLAAERGKTD